eukprot:scaffold145914_cov22-Tisochrysis_lutea.AAC.2
MQLAGGEDCSTARSAQGTVSRVVSGGRGMQHSKKHRQDCPQFSLSNSGGTDEQLQFRWRVTRAAAWQGLQRGMSVNLDSPACQIGNEAHDATLLCRQEYKSRIQMAGMFKEYSHLCMFAHTSGCQGLQNPCKAPANTPANNQLTHLHLQAHLLGAWKVQGSPYRLGPCNTPANNLLCQALAPPKEPQNEAAKVAALQRVFFNTPTWCGCVWE